jgi:hypothetical protein
LSKKEKINMNINCENCGHEIDLNESLRKSIVDAEMKKKSIDLEQQMQSKFDEKEKDLQERMDLLIEDKNKIKAAEIQAKKEAMSLQDKLAEASLDAETKVREEFLEKERNLKESNNKILEAERKKLLSDFDERQKIANETKDMELATMTLKIERMKKEAEEARKTLDHASTSQELVGEAAELHLLDRLKQSFPTHEFNEIKKGAKGADILQTVISKAGSKVGQIYYESKRTKSWQHGWIAKFKDDLREKNIDIGILVTSTFPKDFSGDFAYIEGVWVCSSRFASQLALVISHQLLEVAKVKAASDGKASLQGHVYDYITGTEFISKVRVIAESHQNLILNLDKEKIAMEKIWSSRRKEIERSFTNVAQIFGDLEGVTEGAMHTIEELELIGND